jgi:putative membrane protein
MLSTATTHIRVAFGRHRLLQALLAWYAVVWAVTAVYPVDPHDWLLENLLAVSFVAALALTWRRFPLSDTSYLLITLFLTLHAIGAHYTYAKVPAGFWVQEHFGLARNHYDRLVHFSFGLLMAYPIREVFLRVASTRGFWAYYLPLDVTLAFSAVYEIFEWLAAVIVAPDLGVAYLGTQGDVWDAQKDMLAAGTGALICMLATAWLSSRRRRRVLLAGGSYARAA